jgi:hypothetical protein
MAIFDLTLRGWLHINENASSSREATLEWIPSDTLFSALVSTWAAQGVDVEQRLDSFLGEAAPPFKITSLFPRAGKVRFYPAPPRLPSYAQEQVSDGKSLRKIRWISQGVLDALSNADPLEGKRNLIHHSTVWLTSAELASVGESLPEEEDGDVALWKKQIVPRVVVDRQSQASNLFHTGRVSFGEGCGLWFAVSGEAEWALCSSSRITVWAVCALWDMDNLVSTKRKANFRKQSRAGGTCFRAMHPQPASKSWKPCKLQPAPIVLPPWAAGARMTLDMPGAGVRCAWLKKALYCQPRHAAACGICAL